ncbi:MAG: type I restriction-modification system subunit M [Bacteroidales bacterium]|nr:type I restriction-modification system subunit M [Bacteroidales bacterium]
MALKKSQLYSSIWQACDALRGGMDASQYKDYVLVLLFVRYVSDKYAGKADALVDVPEGGSFVDLASLKGQTNIGEGINKVLSKLAEANGLKGVIDIVDFNDEDKLGRGKEMQDRLSDLIAIFENPDLNFGKNKAEGDDLLGDAYEYLMKHFAVESGKSKGQFYTPAEVSRIIAKVIDAENTKDNTQTVYDPACGSGSLLLKVASEAKPTNISIYGQEKDNPTAALAILNMWLHGEPTAVIKKGQSTLSNPLFTDNGALKTFDYVVANPPFSDKKWRFGFEPENDSYGRFDGFGIPPTKNGDYAFLLHIIKSLKSTGKGACVLPHGVLFRGNAEAEIRTNLIKRGYIKAIIGLPANLFYGTGIPACILVLDKEKASERQGIFMIDASKGFVKDGNKNRLREQDIRKIIDVWTDQVETPKFSHFASNEEIEKNEYNLNLPRYIDTSDVEDSQDIEAHLKGGIPKNDIDNLQNFWDICPNLRAILFKNSDRSGYFDMAISADDVRKTIFDHAEFSHFKNSIQVIFEDWREIKTTFLKSLDKTTHPKTVIAKLSNGLLARFADISLIDKYDVYQHLMNYWEEIMQDDAHIITTDEWQAGNEVIRLQKEGQGKNKGKKKDVAGLEGLEGRLIPTSLIIKTYFKVKQEDLDILQSELEQVGSEMEEMVEEYAGDGDNAPLEEAKNDAGNITKANLTKQIKEIKNNPEYKDDLAILQKYNDLIEKEADCKAKIKAVENELEKKVIAKYPTLSLDEIKILVVERKWMDELQNRIMSEVERTSQTLAGRIKELTERYSETLPQIETETKTLNAKVDAHLAQMGFKI